MKRYVSIAIVLLFLFLWVAFGFTAPGSAQTQAGSAAQPPAAQTSPAAPNGESAARLNLDCKGCHGAGKTLPYLGGELFHKDAHNAYDHGFHARGVQNGKKAATC